LTEPGSEKLRIDKWLWHARFFKTRTLAAAEVSAGHVRLNAQKIHKPAQTVALGDVLTFPKGRDVRVIRVDRIGTRRGPALEAQMLYTDLDPPEERPSVAKAPENPAYDGGGRPTGRNRRRMVESRKRHLE
jgi:ribosome-associated heat shock protein Hsp15